MQGFTIQQPTTCCCCLCISRVSLFTMCAHCQQCTVLFATQIMDFVTIQHVVVFTFPLRLCYFTVVQNTDTWQTEPWSSWSSLWYIHSVSLSQTAAGPHWAPAKAWDLPACAVLVTLQQDPMWMENHCILTQQVSSKTSFTSFNQHFTLISTAGVPVTRHKVTFTSCWLSGKLQLAALRRGIKSYTHRHTKGIIALKRNTSIIGFFFFCCKSTQQLWLFTRQLTRQ